MLQQNHVNETDTSLATDGLGHANMHAIYGAE